MKFVNLLFIIAGLFLTSCAHHVGKDYSSYLQNNQGMAKLNRTNVGKNYVLTDKTLNHNSSISSFTTGIANSWNVKFEEIIDATLSSNEYQKAFGKLEKSKDLNKQSKYLKIDLVNYDFKDHRAYVDLQLDIISKNKKIFSKRYSSLGPSQGGKMFWGGAFAMKNAIQQSTMYAVNDIFRKFTNDVKK